MMCEKGHYTSENVLTCPVCAAQDGEIAFHALQLEFLRKVARGEFNYTLRVAKGSQRHLMMYQSFTRTFCGIELESRPAIRYEPYDDDTLSKVCGGCRSAIRSAMEEALIHAAKPAIQA